MENYGAAILLRLVITVVGIFILRLIGAWMLRINEIITLQKAILAELRNGNKSGEVTTS